MIALIAGAWIAGTLGSVHCLAMCSGIAGSLATGIAPASGRGRRAAFVFLHNAGRISSYAIAGAVLAWSSRIVGTAIGVPGWAQWLRLVAALMLVLLGLQILTRWRPLRWFEQSGAALWQRLSPLARKLVPVNTPGKALGLGLLWGWLPCGLVYSVLPMAAATTSPMEGAIVMAAFGVGTAPSMVASGHIADFLRTSALRRGVIAGWLLILLGLTAGWLPLRHILSSDTSHQHSQTVSINQPLPSPPESAGESTGISCSAGTGVDAAWRRSISI